MLKAYTLLPDGNVLVTTDEGEFAINELPDELLTEEEVEMLNAAFPNALRSDYKAIKELSPEPPSDLEINNLGINNIES